MTKIQYVSGILKSIINGTSIDELIKPAAPYIALCGNCFNTTNKNATVPALKWLSENYETVFWIPGHAEVSSAPVTRSLQSMYSIVQRENLQNIHIGNRLSKGYDGFHVIATSLPLPVRQNTINMAHENKMPYTVVDLYKVQKADYYWIIQEIVQFHRFNLTDTKLLVLTDGQLKIPKFTTNLLMNHSNYMKNRKGLPYFYSICGTSSLNHNTYRDGIVSCCNNNEASYSYGTEVFKANWTIEMV
jgi:hypothetical protein